MLKSGSRALGFGVGGEPLPSYMASLGMQVLASDMPGVTDPEAIFQDRFLPREDFEARVEVSDIHFGKLGDPSLREAQAVGAAVRAALVTALDMTNVTLELEESPAVAPTPVPGTTAC